METQISGFSSWNFMASLPTKRQLGVYSSFTVTTTASSKCWEYAGWPCNVVTLLLRHYLIVKILLFSTCALVAI